MDCTDTETEKPFDRVLVLQGLATPFFSTLSLRLADMGMPVHRVHFCGADWLFRGKAHPGIHHHRFTGHIGDLPAFYRGLITRERIDTILLLGDCRPVHEPATRLAQDMGVRLFAFDEGYIRPGWITMEAGGTNGYSRLPRTAAEIRALAAAHAIQGRGPAVYQPAMGRRALMDIAGHGANILYRPRFPHFRGHRPESLWREARGWIARGIRALMHGRRNRATVKMFETTAPAFFLAPLQLNSDYQIRRHSPFEGMVEFIGTVIASFARNAASTDHLLFKNHPLDNGLIPYARIIRTQAEAHGVGNRVSFIAGGDLETLITAAQGVVLVNSTVGFATLRLGRPLKALGHAVYDMDGLTDQQPLDTFWKNPTAPQQRLAEEFLTVIQTYTQVRGDLFSAEGIACAADEAVEVVTGALPRLPAQ